MTFDKVLLYALLAWVVVQEYDKRKHKKSQVGQAAAPSGGAPSDEIDEIRRQFRRNNPNYARK